jgi:hypothetical protein
LVKELVNYAELTNRWPIFVYEPDLSGRLLELFGRHIDSQHVVVLNNKNAAITDDAKLVYTNKIPRMAIDRIPLMVSSAGMLYGGDRQIWLQAAEKVVYFSNDVYNKNINKGKEVCKLG